MEQRLIALECAGCTAPMSEAIMTNGIHKCPYCGYINILPKEEQSSEVLHHLRNADIELRDYEFERAYNAYAKASELDSEESKAYFGMALASNRVKYIKDVVGNRWQAICCEVTDKKFSEDTNYLHALEHATEEQRAEYEARAKEIDYIREKFVELQNSGLSYDTFICVKVSDENGGFTQDSMWANKLYDSITKSGAKAFYSEKEIGDRVGSDYEALILYALYTSKSMIVVCSNDDYLRTPWVQNEYTRYYSMLNAEEKAKNSIMIAFSEQVIERIPGIPGRIQGVDLHKFDTSQKVNEFVNKFANATERARKKAEEKAKAEAERKAKEEAEAQERRELQNELAKIKQQMQSRAADIASENVKYCTSCGTKNDTDVKFCSSCGNTEFSDTNEKFCINCKESNPIATKFCKNCGKREFVPTIEELERILAQKAEAERKAKEEAERIAREKAEAERKAKEEAERIAREREEARRIAREKAEERRIAREKAEAERKAREEEERIAREKEEAERNAKEKSARLTRLYQEQKKKKIKLLAIISAIFLTIVIVTAVVISLQPRIVYEKVDGGYCVVGLKNSEKFETLEIPATYDGEPVTSIGGSAFSSCYSLTSITIPSSVTSIGDWAFSSCDSLTSITIPDSVTSIGDYAFRYCTSLTSITIPNSVTSIGKGTFYDCDSLTSANYLGTIEQWCNISFSGSYSNPLYYAEKLYLNGTLLTDLVIPDTVTEIKGYAFEGCTSLTSITIPDSVTSIGYYAFSGCTSLETIYCKALSKPSGWDANWKNGCNATVVWGYTGE